jgi:hypothetical protein
MRRARPSGALVSGALDGEKAALATRMPPPPIPGPIHHSAESTHLVEGEEALHREDPPARRVDLRLRLRFRRGAAVLKEKALLRAAARVF